MTWTIDGSQGLESDKVAHLVVKYLQGRFLDIGCGQRTCWPTAIGVDSGHHFGRGAATVQSDGSDLSMFAYASMDGVFSSHMLEHVERSKVPAYLREWARVLKVGGHLVLYVPNSNDYPKVGQPGANPSHLWDIFPGDIEAILKSMVGDGFGWELRESEVRSAGNEYSLLIVARKTAGGWTENVWQRNPDGKKRALVIRYGAIGDAFTAASVLPGLKKQGYHVTYNTVPVSYELLKHDPHIDEWIVQQVDYVPNHQLGAYWEALAERYDHVINLCESIEGALLALPGRLNHGYSQEARRRLCGSVNYLERHHDIAAVPHDFAQHFYPDEAEKRWARAVRNRMNGGPVIVWVLYGSSPHKTYPFIQVVLQWLLEKSPCHVVLMADGGVGKQLQDAVVGSLEGVDLKRVHQMAGVWSIRKSLAFAQIADCVVGPETGPLNAVAMTTGPKVLYLSHSSHDNLTKHWINTTAIEPDERAPCYPCHRLHSDWTYCPKQEETAAALCASSIKPERIFEAVMESLGARKAA